MEITAVSRSASSLTLRCQEVASGLAKAESSLARLRSDFAELQATLARIQADDEIAAFVCHTGRRGDLLRTVLSTLRLSNGPMELRDVTVRAMRALDLDADNPRMVTVIIERVRNLLARSPDGAWRSARLNKNRT
jgi:hypothetical protein